MRLQLTLLFLATKAYAVDVVVSSKVQVYADTDATIVVSPHVNAAATVQSTKTTVTAGYMSNLVGRADDPNYAAPMTDLSGDAVLTQVFTPTLIGQLNLTVGQSNGMIASPYRKVTIWAGDQVAEVVPENEPASRFKLA